MTFPTTAEGKRVAFERMKRAAPELMSDVAALMNEFPGARMTHFKAEGIEYGKPAPEGWQVDQALMDRVNPPQLSIDQQERLRKDKLASQRNKARMGKRK